jgi:hypothetical protein
MFAMVYSSKNCWASSGQKCLNSPYYRGLLCEKTTSQEKIKSEGSKVNESQRTFTRQLEGVLPGNVRVTPYSVPDSRLANARNRRTDLRRLPKSDFDTAERIARNFTPIRDFAWTMTPVSGVKASGEEDQWTALNKTALPASMDGRMLRQSAYTGGSESSTADLLEVPSRR